MGMLRSVRASFRRGAESLSSARNADLNGCLLDQASDAFKLGGMEHSREYDVVLVPEETGGFSVFVPELPSVATQGDTREEALASAKEAIELYLDVMAEDGLAIPTVERGSVAVGA